MSLIYTPKGKAREYSPLAINLYLMCSHLCEYCYGWHALQRNPLDYFGIASPRKNLIPLLVKELQKQVPTEQVLISFIGDPYTGSTDNNAVTRDVLMLFYQHKVKTAVLTKGGAKALRDLALFQKFGKHIQVGATLTFYDPKKSLQWEPGAALPAERLEMLKKLKDGGVPTWASFEPVIEPAETLQLIDHTLQDNSVDVYKIGMLSNHSLPQPVNWPQFLQDCLARLRPAGKKIYIKESLRLACPGIFLTPDEQNPDAYNVV